MEQLHSSEDLVATYRHLVEIGLMDLATGNVSCRVEGGMLISCSGATAQNLTPDRVVFVREDGTWAGDIKPSSEWRMHSAVYKNSDKANAVIHAHSAYCVAMACNNMPLPGFHYMVGMFGG